MYGEFASLYDELMDDIDYKEWSIYIRDILDKYGKRPISMLEMACGTGNLAYYLAKEGYRLTCFDLSNEMLSIAYKKLNEFKNIKFFKQNMINFDFKQRFDCVLSLFDSINYILQKDDLLASFKNVYSHLENGGIFIFDINSQYKLKYIIGDNIFIEDRENIYYAWQNEYNEKEGIVDFYLTFFYKDNGQYYKRADEHHKQRAYSVEEIRYLLKLAGFSTIDSYEAFTLDSPDEKSERINFVALK